MILQQEKGYMQRVSRIEAWLRPISETLVDLTWAVLNNYVCNIMKDKKLKDVQINPTIANIYCAKTKWSPIYKQYFSQE